MSSSGAWLVKDATMEKTCVLELIVPAQAVWGKSSRF